MDLRAPLRLFRAALVTLMSVSLAAAGHVLGGGQLPDIVTLAVTAVLLLGPAAWLARRELSFSVLFGVLGAGQLTLHAAFTAFSPGASCLPRLPLAQLPGSLAPLAGGLTHGGHADLSCTAAMETMPMDEGANSPAVLAGHLLAMLATAWLMRRGEAALWQLLAWLRPLVRLPRPAGFTPASHRPAAWPTVFVAAHRRNLRHDTLRGPPLAVLPRTIE
ncbi:hypothetical protein QFZ23_000588 [Arthrobacter globiformis]|uniref:hypothetical protein n=1 Tax=Arthrobacter globiformis TaxID=1665 RepID=UPI00277E28C7|nr:hypothetical protein [Arthrobacter globiformis]MDQ1056687.1 hypothetical protein [Arthrobacter globiformis]